MFAANYLGAVYVPVNPALKGSTLEHVLHNAGARIAIVHDSVLDRVLAAGATLIGINNRNLHTFEVDLEHTIRLRQQIPNECVVVGESGIRTREDALRLERAGVGAMLVGETLVRQADVGRAVDELLGRAIN